MKQIKSLFTILLAVTTSQQMLADSYYEGSTIKGKTTEGVEINFKVIDPDAKTCKLSSYCINQSTSGKITVPSYVEGFKVVEINSNAFYNCSYITSVELPYTVTIMGTGVFDGCETLTSVTLPNDLTSIDKYTFYGCKSLSNIYIPSTVTTINNYAFAYCKTLTSISGGSGVEEIKDQAFYYCESLTSTSFSNIKAIGDWAFSYCSSLTSFSGGNNLREIGDHAFYECSSLTSFSGGNNLREIGDYAFYRCSSLSSVTGISSVEEIGSYAFHNTIWYNSLPDGPLYIGKVFYVYKNTSYMPEGTKFNIKEGTTYITSYAFNSCNNLTSVSIPKSVVEIGDNPFAYCTNLVSITVDASNSVYDSRNNCNAIIHTASNTLISGCSTTSIPPTVKAFGYCAFSGSSIISITIPDNIDSLASYSLSYCRSLKSLTIGKGVRIINYYAFSGCSQLEDIVVSSSNPYYDSRNNCNGIIDKNSNTLVVGCLNTIIPSNVKIIGTGAFETCSNGNFFTYTIPDHIEVVKDDAFEYNSNLRSITIGKGVKELGRWVFFGCNNLVTIHSKIETPFEIDETTFRNSDSDRRDSIYNHATLYVPIGTRINYMSTPGWNKFKHIVETDDSSLKDGEVFSTETTEGNLLYYQVINNNQRTCELIGAANNVSGNITIPQKANGYSVISLGDRCFYDYYQQRDITSVSIPECVTTIGENAFYYCKNLNSVNLPNNIVSIGRDAFYMCESLTLPSFPVSLEHIGDWAFSYCKGNSITIPASVKEIGISAFTGCKELAKIAVAPDNTVYSSPDDCNAIIEKATKRLITGCKTTTIPNIVECIGKSAFSGMKDLTSISIPTSVSVIDSLAFNNTGLTNIEIPSSVRSIAYCAFRYCDYLKTITSNIQTPFGIPDDVFEQRVELESPYESATLYVPIGTKAAYQATDGWKLFQNIVETGNSQSSYTADGVDYQLNYSNNTAKVIRVFADNTDVVIPSSVKYNNSEFNVTALGDSIFHNNIENYNSYSVTFPASITDVANKAFWWFAPSAIIWNSDTKIPEGSFDNVRYQDHNFLLYVKKADIAPSGVTNLIVNGNASEIILKDNYVFNCPQEFSAEKIHYTHNYQMTTGIGESAGWETIALPFDVQTITHATMGELVPFASYQNSTNKKTFWLYSLSSNGFTKASAIKANTPYLISMPNNGKYSSNYNVAGKVTFSASNATVKRTNAADLHTATSNGATFIPCYSFYASQNNIFALNVTNDYVTYSGNEKPGSVFLSNYRQTYPFEARIEKESSNARMFSIVFADDNETTGIFMPTQNEKDQDGMIKVYNVSGQFVKEITNTTINEIEKQLLPGVYIINGKKTVVKP